jgi:hypothetical protein
MVADFCHSKLQLQNLVVDDIEAAHVVTARSDGSTSHSTATSVTVKTEPIILIWMSQRNLMFIPQLDRH